MAAFALEVATVMLALAYGAQAAIRRRQAWMRTLAARSRPILGVVFVAVGVGLLFRVHHSLEFWALQVLPPWLIDLSVSL